MGYATALLLTVSACCGLAHAENPVRLRLDLDGEWQFKIDPLDAGEQQRWYLPQQKFDQTIRVPGCWQAQGIGSPSGILRHDYSGNAWYRRVVRVPSDWGGRRITLRIGGALRVVTAFVNGQPAGRHDGMSAPFAFDVTAQVQPGADNVIALRVANPGEAPSESPDRQPPTRPTGSLNAIGNWGGLFEPVELQATSQVWLDRIRVRSVPLPFTFDFELLARYWAERPAAYHHTPPALLLYALHEALRLVLEEGLEARWARHADAGGYLQAALRERGLELFADARTQLPQLTAVRVPEGVDGNETRGRLLREYGIEVGGGLAGSPPLWRIGLMGVNATREVADRVLGALDAALVES